MGHYSFFIFAIDTSGNKNKSHGAFEIKDMVPPVVSISYPKENESFSKSLTIKWNATDNYDKKEDLKITIKYSPDNGVSWKLIVEDIENDGEYKWDISRLEDGKNYIIQVIAKDKSGNIGKSFSKNFIIDNTNPTISIEKPKQGRVYIFDREIMPVIGNKAVIIGKITITVDTSDETSGIEKVEFYIDGVYKASDGSPPYKWVWDESVFLGHTIKVISYDKAGNKISKEVKVFVVNL